MQRHGGPPSRWWWWWYQLLTGRRLRPLLTDWQIGLLMVPFALVAGFICGWGLHVAWIGLTQPQLGQCISQGVARCTR